MMPQSLLDSLRSSGFTVRVAAGKLLVSPHSKLTAAQVEDLKANRDQLITVVMREQEESAAPFGCRWCGAETLRHWMYCQGCGAKIADAICASSDGTESLSAVG